MLLDAVTSRSLFLKALQDRYAVLAVNADSPAAVRDTLHAARLAGSPVLIETSLWQLLGGSFGGGDPRVGMAVYAALLGVLAGSDAFREVPVGFHIDHVRGPGALEFLESCLHGVKCRLGDAEVTLRPSSLSIDSSQLTEAENLDAIARLAGLAGDLGQPLCLEIETGIDDAPTPLKTTERLIAAAEHRCPGAVTLYAPGLGTRHGLGHDYPDFDRNFIRQHQETASAIAGRPIGLALHGSSGLTPEQLRAAAESGVVKVNWSSEALALRATAARKYYLTHELELSPTHPNFKSTAQDGAVQAAISASYVPTAVERMRVLRGGATCISENTP